MKFNWNENHMETTFEFGQLKVSGDETKGFRPFQLMVASIASCSGMVFQNILEKQRISLDELLIETEVERNEDEANRIEKIKFHFIIKGKDLNEKKLQRNLELSRKNCSMVQSVKNSIVIEDELTIVQV